MFDVTKWLQSFFAPLTPTLWYWCFATSVHMTHAVKDGGYMGSKLLCTSSVSKVWSVRFVRTLGGVRSVFRCFC